MCIRDSCGALAMGLGASLAGQRPFLPRRARVLHPALASPVLGPVSAASTARLRLAGEPAQRRGSPSSWLPLLFLNLRGASAGVQCSVARPHCFVCLVPSRAASRPAIVMAHAAGWRRRQSVPDSARPLALAAEPRRASGAFAPELRLAVRSGHCRDICLVCCRCSLAFAIACVPPNPRPLSQHRSRLPSCPQTNLLSLGLTQEAFSLRLLSL